MVSNLVFSRRDLRKNKESRNQTCQRGTGSDFGVAGGKAARQKREKCSWSSRSSAWRTCQNGGRSRAEDTLEWRSSVWWSELRLGRRRRGREAERIPQKNGDVIFNLRFRLFECWAGKKLGQGPKLGRNGKNPDGMGKTRMENSKPG
ncbi:hypothetical protein LXL04_035507 [Taraxacum kok-saghyz]